MENESIKREKTGKVASFVGIICNTLLALGKITVGVLFGFISVLADGLNNLSDCGSNVVSLISFKLSSKPADKEHPYGHERIEYISSMIVAFIILIIAFELAKESIAKIITPESLEFSFVVVIALAVSIIVKLSMYAYYMKMAKKINSDLLKATAMDSVSDCISTTAVLISILLNKFFGWNIDGYIGVLVAILICYSGIKIIMETSSILIGKAPDKDIIDGIKQRIYGHKEVLGLHDLSVYNFGPNKYFASVHIELDANTDSLTAHELIDEIEREFALETNILLTGHHDPIVVDDEEVNSVRKMVETIVKDINESFSMHDFRMVKGERNTNVLFDVAIPLEVEFDKEELLSKLKEEIKKINKKYTPVITVEKELF